MNMQQMRVTRRHMLALTGGALGMLVLGGVARAADDVPPYPEKAFEDKQEGAALKALFNGQTATASDQVKLTAPEIAANGAVVPISVESTLPDVTRVFLLVPQNPYPLVAEYILPKGTKPYVSNRIKMGKTSDVIAIVESQGKLFSATKSVKVTVGGCGG